jgi:hypothetical protein
MARRRRLRGPGQRVRYLQHVAEECLQRRTVLYSYGRNEWITIAVFCQVMDSFEINNSNLMNTSNLGFLFVQLRMDVHIKYWASLELDQQGKASTEKYLH